MSQDIRRRLAYFGAREKLYTDSDQVEIPGLPLNWRRVLSLSFPSPIVGPFGCVYADMEHAVCAYRYLHTSNAPSYANYFRTEYDAMAGTAACRRWGCANGMSRQLADPNDRLWMVVRDRCMYDVVYQRMCRDPLYYKVMDTLVVARCFPVYHVRTANANTYWGATMDRTRLLHTQKDRSPSGSGEDALRDLLAHEEGVPPSFPKDILIGRNRLGEIMLEAYYAVNQFYNAQHTTKFHSVVGPHLPPALTDLGPHAPNAISMDSETVPPPPSELRRSENPDADIDSLLREAADFHRLVRQYDENNPVSTSPDPLVYDPWEAPTVAPLPPVYL